MYRIVSLSILLTLIVVLGVTFFKVVAPFLLPLFLAGVAAILTQPLFLYCVRRFGGRVRLASAVAAGTIVLAILLPLTVGTTLASLQLYYLATDSRTTARLDELFGSVRAGTGSQTKSLAEFCADVINRLRGLDEEPIPGPAHTTTEDDAAAVPASEVPSPSTVTASSGDRHPEDLPPAEPEVVSDDILVATPVMPEFRLPTNLPAPIQVTPAEREAVQDLSTAFRTGRPVTPEHLKSLVKAKINAVLLDVGDRSLGLFSGVLFSLISGVIALLIFTVALYYFFADGTVLLAATEKLIPVHVDYQRELLQQFSRVVRSVVTATFLASLGQAFATTIALAVCGFDHLLTLFVVCFLSALIPMLGTWLVWGPCAVLLYLGGHWILATFLVIYGVAVVGMLDNVIRTYVLNSETKLHPLLALISVLGGLQVMGLWGVFIGPIVASCLHALVKIFNHELTVLSRTRFGEQAKAAAGALLGPGVSGSDEVRPVAVGAEPIVVPTTAVSTLPSGNGDSQSAAGQPGPAAASGKQRR